VEEDVWHGDVGNKPGRGIIACLSTEETRNYTAVEIVDKDEKENLDRTYSTVDAMQ